MATAELVEALHAVSGARHYREWFFGKVRPHLGRSVLDIGSGLGDFMDLFTRDSDRKVILSDASDIMVEELHKRCDGIPGTAAIPLDISNEMGIKLLPHDMMIDTITCLNVLEHIQEDVLALRNMRELVTVGGKVVLFVPALEFLYGSLDRMAGHYRRYTQAGLVRCLESAGWRVSEIEYFNFFGIATWFWAGRVFKQNKLNPKTCSGLDKVVPFLSFLENLIPPPAGQSLIAIADKTH